MIHLTRVRQAAADEDLVLPVGRQLAVLVEQELDEREHVLGVQLAGVLRHAGRQVGEALDEAVVERIVAAVAEQDGLVVFDEAYQPFSSRTWMQRLTEHEHVLVMRTLSKFGLAGVRLGYMVGAPALIDEIDKAEPDLPNGLLETLGQYQFTVPYLNQQHARTNIKNPIEADPARLLVVITTNEERELPTAFVRRCLVHTLKMEESTETVDGIEKRVQWLMQRGQLHFGQRISEPVYRQAAELLWQDRMSTSYTRYPPGLAEYIDLLKALRSLGHDEQESRLTKIASYTLKKEVTE